LESKISELLKSKDLDSQIQVYSIGKPTDSSTDKQLVFYVEFIEKIYVVAENNERYRRISAFERPDRFSSWTLSQEQTSLWIKLFMTVAEISGLPSDSIEARSVSGRNCMLRIWLDGARVRADGATCPEEFAGIPTRITVVRHKPEVASALNIPVSRSPSVDQIANLTQEFFKGHNVNATVRERSDRHVVIGAYGLKNAVVVGENHWEGVSFYISDISAAPGSKLELLVVTDGYYTSGLGGPPPRTSYTYPLEPKYYKQLEEFAKGFSEYVRDKLDGR
jgi:hypothetical protein